MKNQIGPFFKRTRQARDVSLSEVAQGRSIATISRYERGEIDLTESLIGVNSIALGLEYNDLMHYRLASDIDREAWTYLATENWDRTKVATLLATMEKRIRNGKINRYLNMVVTVLREFMFVHDHEIDHFRPQAIQTLADYLQGLSEFSRIDGIILQAAMEFIPVSMCATWFDQGYQAVLKQVEALPVDQIQRLIAFAADVASRAGVDDNLELMGKMVNQIEELIQFIPENGVTWYNFRSVEGLYRLKLNDTPVNRQHLVSVVRATQILLPAGYYDLFRQYAIDQNWLSAEDFARTES
jgi:transcriptional regulator with XRE-family HTH domain